MTHSSTKDNNKSKVHWTRELTLKLIQQYESRPNLWDVSSANYKNRNLRKSALEEIADIVGVSVADVNEKIHNLRCQYQSNCRKLHQSKSGQGTSENYTVKWEYYDALKFISGAEGSNIKAIDSLVSFICFINRFICMYKPDC